MISNPWFDYLIIAAIIGNSVVLALNDYGDENNEKEWNRNLMVFGDIFTWLFFAESIIKIVALGFVVMKNSYMRDAWNVVDFIIVVSGVIEFIAVRQNSGGSLNVKPLRILRVIRPLKSINAMPSMR